MGSPSVVTNSAQAEFWRSASNRGWLVRACALIVGCALFTGCSPQPTFEIESDAPPPTDTSFDRLPAILAGISSAGVVLLYEGLPSEFWEPELRKRELEQKETIRKRGYSVYEEPLQVEEFDARRLTALFSASESFAPFRSAKSCGGFQPEFALEWKSDAAVTLALISLECSEVKLFGPDAELYCDLKEEVVLQLKEILRAYQAHNPAPRSP